MLGGGALPELGGGCGKYDGFQSFGKFAVKVEWGDGKMQKRKEKEKDFWEILLPSK